MASPKRSSVKTEYSSSPPPLIHKISRTLEDGETEEQQIAAAALQGEPQLSRFEYFSLEGRHERLQHQHRELQDLATAYSEVVRGFSGTNDQKVSIDQLQIEAGREGLRAKALESELLRPLIREVGSLQALITQTNTMRTLTDMLDADQHGKAGGLRELEHFVSDLRSIRDELDQIRGSRGLVSLAAKVQDLLQSKRKLDRLASEVDCPNGLREKAAKYEKLMKAFADVHNPSVTQHPAADNAAMNPARARMISATPLETDPHRDLYEAPPPVAKPNNRTGSNNTPLGAAQDKPRESSLKRKGSQTSTPGMPTKRARDEVCHASYENASGNRAGIAGVKAHTQAMRVHVTDSLLDQSNAMSGDGRPSSFKDQHDMSGAECRDVQNDTVGSGAQIHKAPPLPKMSDGRGAEIRFGGISFKSTVGTQIHSAAPPAQDVETFTNVRLGPMRFPTAVPSLLTFSSQKPEIVGGAGTALQAMASVPADPRLNQTKIWENYLRHTVALWVGPPNTSAPWGAYQLKRHFQIHSALLASMTGELSRLIPIAKYSMYGTMPPNHDICILRYLIDGRRPSGLPQERTACRLCTHHRRPCALLQEIGGIRIIIFLPLRADARPGLSWHETAFWMQRVQRQG